MGENALIPAQDLLKDSALVEGPATLSEQRHLFGRKRMWMCSKVVMEVSEQGQSKLLTLYWAVAAVESGQESAARL